MTVQEERERPPIPRSSPAGPGHLRQSTTALRLTGLLVALGAIWYVPWLLRSENPRAVWLSWPFIAANLFLVATALTSWINNWDRWTLRPLAVDAGEEPTVAVLVPTYGEPIGMVAASIRSVLTQDWPLDRLVVAVGDDAANPAVVAMVRELAEEFPEATLLYYQPPRRGSPDRRGDAKSGNLNAGLVALDRVGVEADYLETRDADDLVTDRSFLRQCVAQLQADPRAAYVQTIKEAWVEEGDPFGNTEAIFYRGSMLARQAANAVFPCGSGLVWRRAALDDIGQFPTWNLVEDLHSGVEALRRGWRGLFLPITGAMGQTAPEDIPNVFKQRGTWALDTVRLLLWGDLSGLNFRQTLQFLELGMFYVQSVAVLIFAVAPLIGLYSGTYPLITTQGQYALHFWPETLALELYLVALNGRNQWESLWRNRQMWIGLSPVYARAVILAIAAGPRDKPAYTVTRKTRETAWYWRQTLPQAVLVVGLGGSIVYAVLTHPGLKDLDLGSMYWAAFSILLLGTFLRKSWHGIDARSAITSFAGRRIPGWARREAEAGLAPSTPEADHALPGHVAADVAGEGMV